MIGYSERLWAPISWWLGSIVAGAICGWIFLVATSKSLAFVAFGIGTALAIGLVIRYGSLQIRREPDGLRVGAAFLDQAAIGRAKALDRDHYRKQMTTEADARAYLQTRPYLDRGVLVPVTDQLDSVPYWLISSRNPQALARAINAGLAPDLEKETPDGQEA